MKPEKENSVTHFLHITWQNFLSQGINLMIQWRSFNFFLTLFEVLQSHRLSLEDLWTNSLHTWLVDIKPEFFKCKNSYYSNLQAMGKYLGLNMNVKYRILCVLILCVCKYFLHSFVRKDNYLEMKSFPNWDRIFFFIMY